MEPELGHLVDTLRVATPMGTFVEPTSSQNRENVTKPRKLATGSSRSRSNDKENQSSSNPNLLWQSSSNLENVEEYEDKFSDESCSGDHEAGLSEDGSDRPHYNFPYDYSSDSNEVITLLSFHHFKCNN